MSAVLCKDPELVQDVVIESDSDPLASAVGRYT